MSDTLRDDEKPPSQHPRPARPWKVAVLANIKEHDKPLPEGVALIAPSLMGTSSLFILLFYWTFRRVDRGVFESAEMEGASLFQSWWLIALPLARPALMAVGMLAFLFYWNDFINPLLYLRSQTLYTLPVGLLQLQEMDRTNWSLLMAPSALVTLPALIVFALLQRSLLNWDGD